MNTPDPISNQEKIHQLADYLAGASKLLRELADAQILPITDVALLPEWIAKEAEADKALQEGDYIEFTEVNAAIDFLHRQV